MIRAPQRLLRIAYVVTIALFTSAAHANGPQVGFQAGMIFPMSSETIQLASEDVLVRLGDPLAEGEAFATYKLRNLSDSPQSFQMAFSPYGYLTNQEHYDHLDFKVTCRGKELPVRFVKPLDDAWEAYSSYPRGPLPVWDLTMAPNESLLVKMTYHVIWSGNGSWRFAYNARPASLWAGSIERATIRFEFNRFVASLLQAVAGDSTCMQFHASPPGYRWFGDAMTWEFRKWEPSEDVSIRIGADH